MLQVWLDRAHERELRKLPRPIRETIGAALHTLAAEGLDHAQVKRLTAASIPRSFRLRVGQARVLGVLLPNVGIVLVTTVFVKKRPSDYASALRRHERRVRSQTPPLLEYILEALGRRG